MTGDIAYKPVEATIENEKEIIYTIVINDEEIKVSNSHPFWVENEQTWIAAEDLYVGDMLQTSNGQFLPITDIIVEEQKTKVYNLTVSDYHTYFVSETGFWVHNSDCKKVKHEQSFYDNHNDGNNFVLFNETHKNSQPAPKGLGPNNGRLESHHGLQQEWANNNLKSYGYNGKLAPTITIETGKGLPHTIITNSQIKRRNERNSLGNKWSSSLQEELQFIVDDLSEAGFSKETINKVLEQQYSMLDELGVKYEKINFK